MARRCRRVLATVTVVMLRKTKDGAAFKTALVLFTSF